MKGIKSEWPLVAFTTCAPLCAGAWTVVAGIAFLDEGLRMGDLIASPYGVALCVLFVASLGCSTLHLGKPARAIRAFRRLGNSAVSNEVFAGTLFALTTALYLILSRTISAENEVSGMLLAFSVVLAALFVAFQCLAYRMRTVPTWNSLSFSIDFALIALLGGMIVGGTLASFAYHAPHGTRMVLVALAAGSCMGVLCAMCAQYSVVAASMSGRRNAQVLVSQWGRFSIARSALTLIGTAVWGFGLLAAQPIMACTVFGAVLVIAGIAVGRCAFYRFYANVGLPTALTRLE